MDQQERALREQYAASGLAMLGYSFEAAMAKPNIAITLQCGVRAAEKASAYNQRHPHWSERH